MLLPTQQTYGLAATTAMQSMLDGIEEQRKQDEEKRTGKERDKLTEARVSGGEEAKRAREKIASALFGTGSDPAALKMDLIERLAGKLGIDTDEARSSYKLGRALEDALKDMGTDQVRDLAEDIGLVDLGISMDTLLKAIKNPYGDDNERLKEALIKKANGGKLGTEVERVVQRLEDTADPKTLEELKLGPQGYDPTRIEDAETRAERQEDIQAAEAGKKLEDVQKTQDVIEEANDEHASGVNGGDSSETRPVAEDPTALITVLAAAAEGIDQSDETTAPSNETQVSQIAGAGDRSSTEVILEDAANGAIGEEIADEALAARTDSSDASAILPVRMDDIGIYELLKQKLAA